MTTLINQLFLCYAWEDTADVQDIVNEIEHELDAKIHASLFSSNNFEISEDVFRAIDNAKIFILFISDAAKKSDYVKQCVVRAQNTNRNILPVDIGSSLFSSTPSEFKFRSKPYNYKKETSRAQLFGQLKATLGIHVESGDEFGALVHIVTDRDASVLRYGQELGEAIVGQDCAIRLKKGEHLLHFKALEDPTLNGEVSYQVESNDGEYFLNVSLQALYEEKKAAEEKARREAEHRRQLEEEQQAHEFALERERRAVEQRKARQEQAFQRQMEEARQQRIQAEKEGSGCFSTGCSVLFWGIVFLIITGVAPWSLFITIPLIIYLIVKK